MLQPGGRVAQRLQKYCQLYQPDLLELHGCTKTRTFTLRAEDCEATYTGKRSGFITIIAFRESLAFIDK